MEDPISVETSEVDAKNSCCSVQGCIEKVCRKSLWIAIGLGQTLSLLICGTAVTSGLLQQRDVQIPTAQSFVNYALLCLVYTTWLACQRGDSNILIILKHRGWKYFLLAAIDVEANYLIVKAYHFTTVTSVQLLDCFTIPTVLFFSWLFLRVQYRWPHLVGVGICLLGMGALVLADFLVGKNMGGGQNKILGDLLCLAGAFLYGMSNVGQEYVVRSFDRVEYLGMLGMFGSLINGVQFAILERKEVAAVDFSSYEIDLCLAGFSLCLFLLYSLMPVVMSLTSATAVNLNLLSADFYALLFGIFIFHYQIFEENGTLIDSIFWQFHVVYFLSFGLILVGLILFSVKPPNTAPPGGSGTSYTEMAVDEQDGDLQYHQGQQLLCENVSYQKSKTKQPSEHKKSGRLGQCGQYGGMLLKSESDQEDEQQLIMAQEDSSEHEEMTEAHDSHRNSVILSDIPEESD